MEFIQKEEGESHLPADSYSDPGILCPSLSRVVTNVSVSQSLYFDIYLVSRSFYLSPVLPLAPPSLSCTHTMPPNGDAAHLQAAGRRGESPEILERHDGMTTLSTREGVGELVGCAWRGSD